MRHRRSVAVVSAVVLAVLFSALPCTGQPPEDSSTDSASLPRTAWGAPDLQGTWVNNSATPLERPKEFAGKEKLNDEELAALKEKADAVRDGGDAFFGDDFVKAAHPLSSTRLTGDFLR